MTNIVAVAVAVMMGVLPDAPSRTEQVADGVTTQFFFNFKTTSTSHVKTYVNGVADAPAVALNADQDSSPGGSVTFLVAPANAAIVRIERSVPVAQSSVWIPYSAFKAKTLEGVLDNLVMQTQEVNRRIADDLVTAGTTRAADLAAQSARDVGQDAALAVGGAGGNATMVTASGGGPTKSLADWVAVGPVAASATLVTSAGATAARTLAAIAGDVNKGLGLSSTLAAGSTTVVLPNFPAVGVTFSRSPGGVYATSFDPDAYATAMAFTRTIYVDLAAGNDTTGTGLVGAPYKTVAKAMSVAVAAAETSIKILVVTGGADVVFCRDEFQLAATYQVSGRKIHITPDNSAFRLYVTTAQRNLVWSLTAGQTNTYQASRTGVYNVLDMNVKDAHGIPAGYAKASSIATVEATAGSWWQSGSLVYVHTLTNATPVEGQHLVNLNLFTPQYEFGNSAEMYLRNVFSLGTNGVSGYFGQITAPADYSATKLVAYNCAWAYADPFTIGGSARNGLAINSIRTVQIYNSVAAYNSADGFNFHYTLIGTNSVRDYYALTFGCLSYNNGIGNTLAPNINNGFTSHEGANLALIASHAWNNQGPNIANVNACNSVIIGCSSKASAHTAGGATHAAFYFDNATPPAGVAGVAYIEDSEGSDSIWDLSSDGSVPITVRDFIGSKIETATVAKVSTLPGAVLTSQALNNLRATVTPLMTTVQRDALLYPTAGLTIFNTTTSKLNIYTGAAWQIVTSAP